MRYKLAGCAIRLRGRMLKNVRAGTGVSSGRTHVQHRKGTQDAALREIRARRGRRARGAGSEGP